MVNILAIRDRRERRLRFKLRHIGKGRDVRLYFHASNKYLYGEVINDAEGKTITSFYTGSKEFESLSGLKNIVAAEALGKKVATELLSRGIKDVYFDKGWRLYHGRVKAFADGARLCGLNF